MDVSSCPSPAEPDMSLNRSPLPRTCRALARPVGSGAGDGLAMLTMLAGKAVGARPAGAWKRELVSRDWIAGASSGIGERCQSQNLVLSMTSHAEQWPSLASA